MLQKTHKFTTCLSLTSLRRTVFKVISEFTQQDDRKKRTAKRLFVTNANVTGLGLFALVDHVINF